jgi:hypothetical protein
MRSDGLTNDRARAQQQLSPMLGNPREGLQAVLAVDRYVEPASRSPRWASILNAPNGTTRI